VLPMSLAKELKSLRYFCLLSFFFILFLALVIIIESFSYVNFEDNVKIMKKFDFSGTSTTFPTAIFAYLCHPNVLDVFKVIRITIYHPFLTIFLRNSITPQREE
jgi:amino acid permease